MDKEIERAILKTLIYSDIFDYPLSQDELWKFLIGHKTSRESFDKALRDLSSKIIFKKGLYCLLDRERTVDIRIKRRKESRKKIVVAKKIIKQLTLLPTIQFIGISGGLSLGNSERDDDIDLFVIASKGTLWLTRLAMITLLLIIGKYRGRNQRQVSDKICLNMLIDDGALSFPKERQNLYTAHEIVQLMPVFERNSTYIKFINANKWVENFLPNALERGTTQNRTQNNAEKGFRVFPRIVQRISAVEHFAKAVQLWFIKRHLTTETISDSFLAFHPLDYKNITLKEYEKRMLKYEI